MGEDRFHATVSRGQMKLVRGSADHADAIIEADSGTLAGVVYGGGRFADAVRSGDLRVAGDKGTAKRFLSLFPLPARAGAASDQ